MPEGWLGLDEAAKALGVARQTVLHRVQRGELAAVHVNRGRRKGLRIQVKREQAGLLDQPSEKECAVLLGPDRAVEDHRLPGLDEPAGGQVADLGDGELGVEGEVEVLQGGRLFEAGATDAAAQRASLAAGDLVLAEDLEELQVAQLAGAGLGQASTVIVRPPGERPDDWIRTDAAPAAPALAELG